MKLFSAYSANSTRQCVGTCGSIRIWSRYRSRGIEWRAAYSTSGIPLPSGERAQSGLLTFAQAEDKKPPEVIRIGGKRYKSDDWTNIPKNISNAALRNLHLQSNHPLAITRSIIESHFPSPTYKHYNDLFPVVSVAQNFDSLGFPSDHPGRQKTDTYYVNKDQVLRTHTSAHQADTFRSNSSDGYLISADVYRRDAIDKSHYPVFHQMEGARMWDRSRVAGGDLVRAVLEDLETLPKHTVEVEDPNPTTHAERNPLQSAYHSQEEVEAIARHMKRSIENVIVDIFSRAQSGSESEPIRIRWIEAYFPFTSPSWEMEVFWEGDWLELMGCGVVKQDLLINAGVPQQLGWAFGMGLERIAMLLFKIPDIRLFWSQDPRFLSQFSALKTVSQFVPFSKYPPCWKDVSFWLPDASSSDEETETSQKSQCAIHENDLMEIVRETAADNVETVQLVDEFTHPKTGRQSRCYRVNYRSLEKTLTHTEANELHQLVRTKIQEGLGVILR
ncbi:MAG: hypothetical protein M1814_005015 [Vezdaea aestivalis]|nr:MAG: hypothetical protein M1814_005015 [Vezdaea aestivalis]